MLGCLFWKEVLVKKDLLLETETRDKRKKKQKQRRYKTRKSIKLNTKQEVTVSASELYFREFIATLDHQLKSNYRYNLFNST